ncbi:MAG: hypothetical protein AUI14_17330 [Actinobacteria bacterium 13_2_20CM_2_71_6]|nr:MAG: hypothetical protein AUI14_17330 [Actinobacteria bacterium 13_2_20CM_2_71_6]
MSEPRQPEEPGDSGLERRYRRLLAWYPAEHRRVYADEMLGVLLAGARAGQRRPGLWETVDLIRSAVWMRLGRTATALSDSRWADAAAVLGVLVPMLLFARQARYVLGPYLWAVRLGDEPLGVRPEVWAPLVAWGVVAVLALSGWRVVTATLAWIAVLGEATMLGLRYLTEPVTVLYSLWPLVLGLTAAAALSVRGTTRRGITVLGRRRIVVFAAAATVGVLASAIDPLTARVTRSGDVVTIDLWLGGGGGYLPGIAAGYAGLLTRLVQVAAAVTMLVAVARTTPPVRRRLLALVAPTLTLVAIVSLFFAGFAESSVRFTPPVLLVPEQWIVLALAPLAALPLGVAVVGRRERRQYLIQLGEAAERQLEPDPQ